MINQALFFILKNFELSARLASKMRRRRQENASPTRKCVADKNMRRRQEYASP